MQSGNDRAQMTARTMEDLPPKLEAPGFKFGRRGRSTRSRADRVTTSGNSEVRKLKGKKNMPGAEVVTMNILFMCVANSARSQLAQGIAKQIFEVNASFILGGIWFVVVVAKPYVVALGRQNLPAQKPSPLYMFGPVVCNLFGVITSAILIQMLKIESVADALALGTLVGIGYILSTVANVAINPNFPRPFLYTLINSPYFIASSLMTSVILVVMK